MHGYPATYCMYCMYFIAVHMSCVVPSPPSDLAVKLRFIDYKPVVTMTWEVSECSCVCESVRYNYSKVLSETCHSQVPNQEGFLE